MGMTPYEFMAAFVEGNYDDFVERPECIRRAFNASVSASHMADHYFTYMRKHEPAKVARYKGIGDYVESLYQLPGEGFRDIRSISNAYKHLYTERSSCSISSAGSIDCVRFEIMESTVEAVEQDWVSAPENVATTSKVIYRRRDGTQGDILDALTHVVDYWRSAL